MAIVSTVKLPVEANDPREAVRQWIKILKSQTRGLDGLQIDAGLISMADKGVLVCLAERLPGKALGFLPMGSVQSKTASEFLADSRPSFWVYRGTLTEYMPPLKVLALIEELIYCPPKAIRSTSFMLDGKGLRWKDSPAKSSGRLHLFDFRGFGRKTDFRLRPAWNVPPKRENCLKFRLVCNEFLTPPGFRFTRGQFRGLLRKSKTSLPAQRQY